jgi:hypothetical protein
MRRCIERVNDTEMTVTSRRDAHDERVAMCD